MAIGVDRKRKLVASNFITVWGSVGFFGPLTVHPDFWDKGVATQLMPPTLELLDEHSVQWAGLFTFAEHIGLYKKFGFVPQQLTALFSRPVSPSRVSGWSKLTEAGDRDGVIRACAEACSAIYDGLDMKREILAVLDQGLGDVVLLDGGDRLDGFAVCHIGAGSEAGSGTCYVKAAAVRPGLGARDAFSLLLGACEDLAFQRNASVVIAGVNAARREAYAQIQECGFSAGRQVSIQVTL